jgi:hypothetical protein
MEKIKSRNTNDPLTQSNFVDCGETVKKEDIKKEINEDERVDDPLSIQGQTNSDESENIVTEVCQEEAYVQPTEEAGKCNHLFKHAKNSKDPQLLFQSRL